VVLRMSDIAMAPVMIDFVLAVCACPVS
jgi:hypothetical protein